MKITFIIAFMKIIASLVLCQPLYHSASNNYKSMIYPPLPSFPSLLHLFFAVHVIPFRTPFQPSKLHYIPIYLRSPPSPFPSPTFSILPPFPWFRMKPRLANVMKMRATHFLPPSPKHTQPNQLGRPDPRAVLGRKL